MPVYSGAIESQTQTPMPIDACELQVLTIDANTVLMRLTWKVNGTPIGWYDLPMLHAGESVTLPTATLTDD